MFATGVVLSCVLAAPAIAHAEELYATRGGWDIAKGDDSCSLSMEFEGPGETMVLVDKDIAGQITIGVTNANWSARKGQSYSVSFELNGTTFGGGGAIGIEDGSRRGFAAKFLPGFEGHLARGSTLYVRLGETLVDELSLTGTAAALASVNACLREVRIAHAAAERERTRWSHIPKDPFAHAPTSPVASPPTPRGNPGAWVSTNDYPSAALREEREGRVTFRATVGIDGRVSDCIVVQSSGSADLDEVTCTNVKRRARFQPATDAAGEPTVGEWSNFVNWSIPKD